GFLCWPHRIHCVAGPSGGQVGGRHPYAPSVVFGCCGISAHDRVRGGGRCVALYCSCGFGDRDYRRTCTDLVGVVGRASRHCERNDPMSMRVEHVAAGYSDDRSIVKDVSFEAQPGQVTTLLGPNGCGKSTLLKALSRLLVPSQGRVLVGDKDVHSLGAREAARLIALLPQHPSCPPGLTVGELVERGRHPYRRALWGGSESPSEDRKKVLEALEKTATDHLAARDVAALSGGQRQRVWMAMVLAQDTPVVLLDEPTTYLDPAHAMEILGIVRELAREGKTVVTVLHDLSLAGAFSDTMIVMKEGEKIAQGTPREALTEDVLHEAYGLRAEVWEDPRGTAPIIVP